MPPKNYKDRELFLGIKSDNGEIRELGRMSKIPTDCRSVRQEKEYIDSRDGEFSMELSGFSKTSDLFLHLFPGLDAYKITQNNWRKLHNLPMKRRGYHGSRKRNNF